MMRFFPSKHVPIALGVLSLGQVLYLFGFKPLYVLGLVYLIAVAVPYPAICRSLLSRLVVSFVLVLSLLQVVAAVQFLVFPRSGFVTVSLIMYCFSVAIAILFRRSSGSVLPLVTKLDAQAIVMVLFFALPTAYLFYGNLSPSHILAFTGMQGQDALSHYSLIIGVADAGHLNYRTEAYYPLGFHFASAFVLDGVHANQRDLDWIAGQRVYVGLYLAWGTILSYLIFYVASQALAALNPEERKGHGGWILALTLGPVTALLYLVVFMDYGFLSYYYVVAAVLCGLLFMYDYDRERLATGSFAIYMLCVFAVFMSWGPLLAPALLLMPTLYILSNRSFGEALGLLRRRAAWAVIVLYLVELVPLAIHLRYSVSGGDFGLNAPGGLNSFHYGLVILGLGFLLYFVLRHQSTQLGSLVTNTLVSFYLLLGGLVLFQYFTIGELRYYVDKTALLVEIIVLAYLAACLVWAAARQSRVAVREWLTIPLVFAVAVILLVGLTGDPLLQARQVFRTLLHSPLPQYYSADVASFGDLATENRLRIDSNEVLHYSPGDKKIYGNGFLWLAANVTHFEPGRSSMPHECRDRIYSILTFGTGSAEEQQTLIASLKECIAHAKQKNQPYYVITDSQSAPYLREILGDGVTYVY